MRLDSPYHEPQYAFVKLISVFKEQGHRGHENERDKVFTYFLEPCQTYSFHITLRENLPVKDGPEDQRRYQQEGGDDCGGSDPSAQEQRGYEQGDAFQVPRGDPKLGWQIRTMSGKNTHPLVSQGVQEIKTGNEKIGDANEEKIVVLQELT